MKKDVDGLDDVGGVDAVVVGGGGVVVRFHGAQISHQVPVGYLKLVYQTASLTKASKEELEEAEM